MKRIGDRYQGYAFDSALDVLTKVQYAKEAGLKGIFFWEIGQDSYREDYDKEMQQTLQLIPTFVYY